MLYLLFCGSCRLYLVCKRHDSEAKKDFLIYSVFAFYISIPVADPKSIAFCGKVWKREFSVSPENQENELKTTNNSLLANAASETKQDKCTHREIHIHTGSLAHAFDLLFRKRKTDDDGISMVKRKQSLYLMVDVHY